MHLLAILLHLLISKGECVQYLQPNLALGKQAYQVSDERNSSTFQGAAKASRATDGNFSVNISSNSCSRTERTSGPWWLVDLGQNYQVTQVAITTRNGDYCTVCDNFSEFYIGVGSSFNIDNQTEFDPTAYNVCWYQESAVPAGETWVFTCTQEITGRFVTIYFPTTKTMALNLCEVQVTNSPRMSGYFSVSTPAPVNRSLRMSCLTQCVRDASCTSVKITPDGTCQLLTAGSNDEQRSGVDYKLLH